MIIEVMVHNQVVVLIVEMSQKFLINVLVINLVKILLNFFMEGEGRPGMRMRNECLNVNIVLKLVVRM